MTPIQRLTSVRKDQLFPYRLPDISLQAFYFSLMWFAFAFILPTILGAPRPKLTLIFFISSCLGAMLVSTCYLALKRFSILSGLEEIPFETISYGRLVKIRESDRHDLMSLKHAQIMHRYEPEEGNYKEKVIKFRPLGVEELEGYVVQVQYFQNSSYLLFLPKIWLV